MSSDGAELHCFSSYIEKLHILTVESTELLFKEAPNATGRLIEATQSNAIKFNSDNFVKYTTCGRTTDF